MIFCALETCSCKLDCKTFLVRFGNTPPANKWLTYDTSNI